MATHWDRPPHYGIEYLAEAERMRAAGIVFDTEVIDFAAARGRLRPASVDWKAEAEEFYRKHPDYLVIRHDRRLARLEKQLAGGVYLHGPRKGQPLDERTRALKESAAQRERVWLAAHPGPAA